MNKGSAKVERGRDAASAANRESVSAVDRAYLEPRHEHFVARQRMSSCRNVNGQR